MGRISSIGRIALIVPVMLFQTSFSAGAAQKDCANQLSREIPSRLSRALPGSTVMEQVLNLRGAERDTIVVEQVLAGNVPTFLRHLSPIEFSGALAGGADVQVTICVTPDYLSVGNDTDFVRVPMGLPAAAEIADAFGFFLPTTKMVDAIYAQAAIRLPPRPMQAGNMMTSTAFLVQHNATVAGQRAPSGLALELLTAGQKKDLVLSPRLLSRPGKVAIYGWHRANGVPIQPLSTVHVARYADYSHGVRLVSATAYVNGRARPLADIMQDPQLAAIISNEGPIANAQGLLASLYR